MIRKTGTDAWKEFSSSILIYNSAIIDELVDRRQIQFIRTNLLTGTFQSMQVPRFKYPFNKHIILMDGLTFNGKIWPLILLQEILL